MDQSMVPFSFQEQPLQTIMIAGEVWFIANEVCKILEHSDVSMAVSRLDEDEKLIQALFVSGQQRNVLCVNESGLYHLIFTSRKEQAKSFRRWVTMEVLPAIRKTGSYSKSSLPAELNPVVLQQQLDNLNDIAKKVLSEPIPFYMGAHIMKQIEQQKTDIQELQEWINRREVEANKQIPDVVGAHKRAIIATQNNNLLTGIILLLDTTGGSWQGLIMHLRGEMEKAGADLDGVPRGLSHLSRHLKRLAPGALYHHVEIKMLTRTGAGRPVHLRKVD